MNVDDLLKEALREQAAEVGPAPVDLADRVFVTRRRRRTRAAVSAAVAVTAVVAAAVVVPRTGGDEDVRPMDVIGPADVVAHPDQSPPKDVIAAGRTALASFTSYKSVYYKNGDGRLTRTYGVLDPTTKTYRKTAKWSVLTVAPGLRTAAVLEQKLPARRIGLLDLATNKVERWIPVTQGAAGIEYSADGSKLLATTYKKDPDHLYKEFEINEATSDGKDDKTRPGPGHPSRTGFSVIDVASGKGKWVAKPQVGDQFNHNAREDFSFSPVGNYVFETSMMGDIGSVYYDFEGRKVPAPAGAEHVSPYVGAGLSPDRKHVGGEFAGKGKKIAVAVNDARTGKLAEKLPAQQVIAWADSKRIIAWGCDPKKCGGTGEFHNQLLLITLGSHKVVPLSDFRKASADYPGRWEPQFQTR